MSVTEPNSTPQPGDLREDFELGCECALVHLQAPVTYLYVGRGPLPEASPGVTYVRSQFDPAPKQA